MMTHIGHLQRNGRYNFEFLKIQDGGRRHVEHHKIAIYPQRFDRSLRNLVRWCQMGLLTALTVKKFEFHKSKMADAAILRTVTLSYLSNLLTDFY